MIQIKVKHPFEVNQVWISETHPENSFFIYQLYCEDQESVAWSNDNSFILTARINENLFYRIVEDYQEKHNVKDRTTTYPFSIWGEFKINSLKQYVRKYNCKLLCKENFEEQNHTTASPDDYFITIKNENDAIAEIWKKYSK